MAKPQNTSRSGRGKAATEFRPGQSGNPGGRPQGLRALIQKRIGKDGQKLVEFWCLVAFSDDAEVMAKLGTKQPPRWQDRIAALQELADRGFGRPTQSLEHDHTGGIVLTWLAEGIEAVRNFLPRCWFDAQRCEVGIEALTHYRKKWNERLQQFEGTPEHDFASHGADAFRYLAVRHRPPQPPKKQPVDPFILLAERSRSGDPSLGWMGC